MPPLLLRASAATAGSSRPPPRLLQGRPRSPGHSRGGVRSAVSLASAGGTSRARAKLTAAREDTHRFASVAGAAHIERQETARLMRRSLGLAHGVAFEVFPRRGTLPPFGTAVIQVAAVADLPGDYNDVLELRMDGVPDRLVPITAAVGGSPLSFAPTTAGLNLAGWGGTVGPTLSFGEHPEGVAALGRHVTVLNSSPMDAHLTWHVAGDRHPAAAVPPCSVDITANALPELSLDDTTAASEALARGGWQPVTVTIRAQSDRAPAGVDLPFSVYPPTVTVPAYGKAAIKVCKGGGGAGGSWTICAQTIIPLAYALPRCLLRRARSRPRASPSQRRSAGRTPRQRTAGVRASSPTRRGLPRASCQRRQCATD